MACYYYIKLPGGGQVRVPANFTPITDTDSELYKSLENEIETFYDSNKEIKNDSKLIDKLLEFDTGLETNILKSIIKKSNKKNLVENLNKTMKGNTKNMPLIQALRGTTFYKSDKIGYLAKNSNKWSSINFNEFLNKLNEPIQKRYLSGVNVKGLLDIISPTEMIKKLDNKIEETNEIGVGNDGISFIKRLIDSYYKRENRKAKIFYDLEFDSDSYDAIVVKDENLNNDLIFYNTNNDLSLFMGIIKSIGSTLENDKVFEILNEYNNSVNEKFRIDLSNFSVNKFFIGEFIEENGKTIFVDPEFNKLFRFKKSASKVIDNLADLLSNVITRPNESLKTTKDNIIKLFNLTDPDKLVNKASALERKIINQSSEEIIDSIELTQSQKANIILPIIDPERREYHYAKRVEKQFDKIEDMYNYIINNIKLEEDLLLVERPNNKLQKTRLEYVIPYSIKISGDSLLVSGYNITNGKYNPVSFARIPLKRQYEIEYSEEKQTRTLKSKEANLVYRKLETKVIPLIEEKDAEKIHSSEAIVIVSEGSEFLPEELIRDAVVRGASITYESEKDKKQHTRVVKQVFPGLIKGNSFFGKKNKEIIEPVISEKRVKTIVTHRSLFEDEFTDIDKERKLEILQSHDSISTGKRFFPVQKGDYIQYVEKGKKRYNKVLSVTDDVVYILIKTSKDNYLVKPINKLDINEIYKPKHNINVDQIKSLQKVYQDILDDGSSIIKESEYSAFNNYELSSNDDYFLVEKDNLLTIYKITNKDKKEGIEFVINKTTKNLSYRYTNLPDNVEGTFLTKRNIFSKYAWNIAEINNIYISIEKSNLQPNEEWLEAKYVIPKDLDINELDVLRSGNILRGKVLTKNREIPSNFKDVTEQLIKILSKDRDVKTPEGLFIKQKSDSYWVRYNASLYQVEYTQDKEKYLQNGSYIVLKANNQTEGRTKSGKKTYRILSRSNDIVTLEYSTFNNDGKLISIFQEIPIKELSDKIKWLYVLKGNNFHQELDEDKIAEKIKEKEKAKKQKLLQGKELLESIREKYKSLFDIEVKIENHTTGELKNKKAWIQTGPLKKTVIVLNAGNSKTSEQDLIHEYLHLFLIALKYNNTDPDKVGIYEKLLLDYKNSFIGKTSENDSKQKRINLINSTNDINLLEELFVEDISKIMLEEKYNELEEFNYDNFNSAIESAINSLELESNEPFPNNILGILNHKMSSIFPTIQKSKIKKNNLILFDTNFREWLDENIKKKKIKVTCE